MRTWWPWCAAILLLLWQVDFQFAYGFLAETIQKDTGLTTGESTAVSSAFLLAYGLMQVPAGLLIDRFGVRWVLPIAGSAAAGAVALFAGAETFGELVAARLFAGVFMAFVFPSAGKIARIRLPAARFALAMAPADMCFGVGAATASNSTNLMAVVGWRHLMKVHGLVGTALGVVVAISLVGMPRPAQIASSEGDLPFGALLFRKNVLLAAGLYIWGAGLTFGFGGYWNLKLQAACQRTAPQVSALSTALFAGLAIGMLSAGLFAETATRRRVTLRLGSVVALVLLAAILWVSPTAKFVELVPLMVGLGASLGTCALSFAVAIPDTPIRQSGTVIAVVNAAGCLGGALLQELPIWLGRDADAFEAMYVVYLAIAVVGVGFAFALPAKTRPS